MSFVSLIDLREPGRAFHPPIRVTFQLCPTSPRARFCLLRGLICQVSEQRVSRAMAPIARWHWSPRLTSSKRARSSSRVSRIPCPLSCFLTQILNNSSKNRPRHVSPDRSSGSGAVAK